MAPKKIKLLKDGLFIKWADESESTISLKYLRDECPCASCQGETILLKTYRPAKPSKELPGMYEISDIQQVGTYAIQISFKDGHNTGIYSWDYLKRLADDEHSGDKHNYTPLI